MKIYRLPNTKHSKVLIHLVRECNMAVRACHDVAVLYDDVKVAMSVTQECLICCDEYMKHEVSW